MPVLNGKALVEERIKALKDYHTSIGVKRAELDVSGGVDSAVMLGLLVGALGADNITAVHSGINTNPEQTKRAVTLCKALGVRLINMDLTQIFNQLTLLMQKQLVAAGYNGVETEALISRDPTVLGSIRSTLRAPVGRGLNRLTGGGIRHGTGNECEDRYLRFFQKGGDGEVDSNPIEMLSKTEVFQLSHALGEFFPAAKDVYRTLIDVKPSADLWGNGDVHNDEDEIAAWLKAPMTYGQVDSATGKVLKVGTIERVARFLDGRHPTVIIGGPNGESLLFSDREPNWEDLTRYARPYFSGFTDEQTLVCLKAARTAEARTRHKSNTNIPIFGSRKALVDAGILSNELPAETTTTRTAA